MTVLYCLSRCSPAVLPGFLPGLGGVYPFPGRVCQLDLAHLQNWREGNPRNGQHQKNVFANPDRGNDPTRGPDATLTVSLLPEW